MASDHSTSNSDVHYQPCERRFRSSRYFLEDQLRCSEALDDFRSVRNLLQSLSALNPKIAFQFQSIPIPPDKH